MEDTKWCILHVVQEARSVSRFQWNLYRYLQVFWTETLWLQVESQGFVYTKDNLETHNAARHRLYFSSVEHCHPTAVGQVGSPLASLGKPGIAPEFKAEVDRLLKMGIPPSKAYRLFKGEYGELADGRIRLVDFQRRKNYLLKSNPNSLKSNSSVGQLISFCDEFELHPGRDPHFAGVVPNYEVKEANGESGQYINFTLSTNHLMGICDVQRSGDLPCFKVDGGIVTYCWGWLLGGNFNLGLSRWKEEL